jgi:type IV pilus assembly protein PilB
MSNAPSSHDRDHASEGAELDPAIVELLDVLRDKGAPAAKLDAVQEILTKAPTTPAAACLVEHGIDEVLVQETVAGIAGIPFERIELERGAEGAVEGRLVQRLTADYCKSSGVMPLRMDGTRPVVGVTQDNVFLVDDIKTRLGVSSVKIVLITASDLAAALKLLGHGQEDHAEEEDINELLRDVEDSDVQVEQKQADDGDLEAAAGQSPVIRIVNHIIQTAVKEGASDIHIEPAEKKIKVRYRVDGELM